jgi:hypothetical protein
MAVALSTGAGADLLIFSAAMNICDAHKNMERMAGYCVWMDDFVPVSIPYRRLIESVLWHIHGEGLCCAAVSGLFPAYLAGRFKQVLFAGLYISIYRTPGLRDGSDAVSI